MSVNAEERKESGMQFLDTAIDLAEFSYRTCKKLPNRWREEFGKKIEDMAMEVMTNAMGGNSVYVKTKEDATLRRKYMMTAYASVRSMIPQILLAERLFPLCGYLNYMEDGSKKRNELSEQELKKLEAEEKRRSRKIMERWCAFIHQEERLLKKIIESDWERFKNLKQ